jgi:hypothetical protein
MRTYNYVVKDADGKYYCDRYWDDEISQAYIFQNNKPVTQMHELINEIGQLYVHECMKRIPVTIVAEE